MANIKYNGKSSDDFYLKLLNTVVHEMATNDITLTEVEGRDGFLLTDNHRLKAVEQSFDFVLKDTVNTAKQDIAEWLTVKGWKDLELSWDTDHLYQATVVNHLSIDEVIRQFGKLRIVFLIHPIKYLKSGLSSRSISNGQTVMNNGNTLAKPIIELTGSGDTTLTINGRQTKLEDVQGGITLDMHRQIVHHNNLSKWECVLFGEGLEKPYLDIGANQISWTGSFTMKIKTMEGVKV